MKIRGVACEIAGERGRVAEARGSGGEGFTAFGALWAGRDGGRSLALSVPVAGWKPGGADAGPSRAGQQPAPPWLAGYSPGAARALALVVLAGGGLTAFGALWAGRGGGRSLTLSVLVGPLGVEDSDGGTGLEDRAFAVPFEDEVATGHVVDDAVAGEATEA